MNQQHIKILKDLSAIGLANAASAFSMITNDRVTFCEPSFGSKQALSATQSESIQLLFTPFLGEILFESYLVVSESNAEKVAGTMMPATHASNPDMAQAALLELDNIISASIATKFSDLLSSQITGDIPRAYHKSFSEAQSYIDSRLSQFNSYTSCYSRFRLVHTQAEAEFIFLFKDGFDETLEGFIGSSVERQIHAQSSQEARRFIG